MSSLLGLPPELRQQIWSEVLGPRHHGYRQAHFHIYDTVYDSCTYIPETIGSKHRRTQARQTARLRTCKAVYSETVQTLYDSTRLTLIVFAGLPRPETHDSAQNLKWRNCLGGLASCALLKRLRHVAVHFQPSEHPDVKKYARRVKVLIDVMDSFARLNSLTLSFNFGQCGTRVAYPKRATAVFRAVVDLLTTCKEHCVLRRSTLVISSTDGVLEERFAADVARLQEVFGIQQADVRVWVQDRQNLAESPCLAHGAWGSDCVVSAQPVKKWEDAMLATALVTTLPITVAIGVGGLLQRRKIKGEKWSDVLLIVKRAFVH